MANRFPLVQGEWYHIYDRGVDKRTIFLERKDYEIFLLLMYLSNTSGQTIHLSDLKNKNFVDIFENELLSTDEPIVEIGAYCLMPNHIHIALRALTDKSISLFMQRVLTGYTMFFNKKYERTGALFSSTFKSKHVAEDIYFKQLISYIHLNPAEIFDHKWKSGGGNLEKIRKEIKEYKYSSLLDFLKVERLERKIISNSVFNLFDKIPPLEKMLREAHEYYREHFREV